MELVKNINKTRGTEIRPPFRVALVADLSYGIKTLWLVPAGLDDPEIRIPGGPELQTSLTSVTVVEKHLTAEAPADCRIGAGTEVEVLAVAHEQLKLQDSSLPLKLSLTSHIAKRISSNICQDCPLRCPLAHEPLPITPDANRQF